MPQSHPTEAELSKYLDNELAYSTRIESHLHECLACCELAESLLANSTISHGLLSLAELHCREPVASGIAEPVLEPETIPPTNPLGYEIIDLIGRGGYGVVYKARDLRLHRTVALKFASGSGLSDEGRTRFRRESKLAASLQHPNIVRVYDVIQQNDRPCLAMEFVSGGSLDQWIRSADPDPHTAARLASQIARAVHFAHTRGVVHRDLKPPNILLEKPPPDGQSREAVVPKVSDFGLARHSESNIYITQAGTILGTPAYMSPEQVEGHEVSGSTDVYSLGCILYEMLTGRPPFKGANTREQIRLVLEDTPLSPRSIDPSIPRDLDTICLKCLEKEPEVRYGSAAELADDLDRFLNGYPVLARRISVLESVIRTCRRYPITTLMAGSLIASILIAVTIVTLQWGEAEQINDALLAANSDLSRTQDELAVELSSARRREETSVFERGLKLAEAGEVAVGMLWMASSLEMSERHAAREGLDSTARKERREFQRMIRLNLAAWSDYLATRRIRYSEPLLSKAITTRDGRFILAAAKDGLRRWRTDKNVSELWLNASVSNCTPQALSLSGQTLLVARDGRLKFVDTRTRRIRAPVIVPTGQLVAAYFAGDSEDEVVVVVRVGGVVKASVWRDSQCAKSRELPGLHPYATPRATVSQDGRMLLVQVSDQRHLLKTDTLEPVCDPIVGAGVCPDVLHADSNSIWLAGSASVLKQIDVRSQELLREVSVRPYRAWHHISADGRTLLSGGAGGTVHRQDIQSNVSQSLLAMTGRLEMVGDRHLLLDGCELIELPRLTLRSSGRDSSSVVKPDRTEATFDLLRRATFDDLGRRAIVITGGIARLVDTRDATYIGGPLYPEPMARVHSGDISPDGKLAATGTWAMAGLTPSNVTIWNAETGEKLFGPLQHLNYVSCVVFSPSGDVVAAGDYRGEIRLWDTRTGEVVGEPFAHTDIILSLAYSKDGKWLAAGSTHDHSGRPSVRIWNIETRKEYPALGHAASISSIAFSNDGDVLITNDGRLQAWDWRRGKMLWRHSDQPCERFVVSAKPNIGIAAAADGSIRSINLRTGKQEGRAILQEWPAESLAVHPDGELLTTGTVDGATRLWDLVTAKPVGPPVILASPVAAVGFGEHGESVVSISLGAPARIWGVPKAVRGTAIEVAERLNRQTGARLTDGQAVRLKNTSFRFEPNGPSSRGLTTLAALNAEQDGDWFATNYHLTNLIALDNSNWSLFARRARALARLGDRKAASDDYACASKLLGNKQSKLVDWYKHCAADLRRIDAWDAAHWYLGRIISAEPNHWRWYAQRAEANMSLGRDTKQKEDEAQAVALCNDLNYVTQFLNTYATERRWDDALALAERLYQRFPDDTRMAHTVALLQLKSGQIEEHKAILRELVDNIGQLQATDCNDIAWSCAVGNADITDLKTVYELLKRDINTGRFPSDELYAPLNTLAMVAYRLSNFKESVEYCHKAIKANGRATEWEYQILRACNRAVGDDVAAEEQSAAAKRIAEKSTSIWEQIELEIVRQLGR